MDTIPPEYLEYLEKNGATEGELAVDPGWYALWTLDEMVEYNAAYEVAREVPGHYGFGSNGGGEMFAFNAKGNVVMIPFIGMCEEEAILVAETWADFEKAIVKQRP